MLPFYARHFPSSSYSSFLVFLSSLSSFLNSFHLCLGLLSSFLLTYLPVFLASLPPLICFLPFYVPSFLPFLFPSIFPSFSSSFLPFPILASFLSSFFPSYSLTRFFYHILQFVLFLIPSLILLSYLPHQFSFFFYSIMPSPSLPFPHSAFHPLLLHSTIHPSSGTKEKLSAEGDLHHGADGLSVRQYFAECLRAEDVPERRLSEQLRRPCGVLDVYDWDHRVRDAIIDDGINSHRHRILRQNLNAHIHRFYQRRRHKKVSGWIWILEDVQMTLGVVWCLLGFYD